MRIITGKDVSTQSYNVHDYIRIEPDCDNPLDLCRIFSRSRYANDYGGYKYKRDRQRITQQARVITHDHTQKVGRVTSDRLSLHIHNDMIKVKCRSAFQKLPAGGGVRGVVSGFSRASRKRMIDLMCTQREGTPQTFISLTYPDEKLFVVSEDDTVQRVTQSKHWKNHIEILRKRIERKFTHMKAIWRIELKQRKSGQFVGMVAPHYHMIIWGVSPDEIIDPLVIKNPKTFDQWLRDTWYEIVDSGLEKHRKHGTHVSRIKSGRHAMFYVSDYVAKTEDEFEDDYEVGRRWGRIGKFDTSVSMVVTITQAQFVHFRRLIRSWLKSRNSGYYKRLRGSSLDKGFSVYGIGDNGHMSDNFAIQILLHAVNVSDYDDVTMGNKIPFG